MEKDVVRLTLPKVLFITNLPSPYRVQFFNEMGKKTELTVVFEAKRWDKQKFDWIDNYDFNAIFLANENPTLRSSYEIVNIISKNKFDFIFLGGYSNYTTIIAIFKCRFEHIPYIIEIDGGIPKKSRWYKKIVKDFLVKKAAYVFSTNKYGDELFIDNGINRNRIIRYPFSSVSNDMILREPVSAEEKIALKKELGIYEEKIVLYVGQFVHRKGIDVLVKSMHGFDANIGLYLVGDNIPQEYEELIRSESHTHVIGFLKKDNLAKYYMASDLFVLPTREDVWGLVVNEAMAYGLPVITTDMCGASSEMLKGLNTIVKAEDSEKLHLKIREVLYDNNKHKMVAKKSLEIVRDYTIETMTETHLNFIYSFNA